MLFESNLAGRCNLQSCHGEIPCLYPRQEYNTRLELEAALDVVKLSIVVKQELDLSRCPCFFWSDSTIVHQSLQANSKKFS